jgi:hypothetical protein
MKLGKFLKIIIFLTISTYSISQSIPYQVYGVRGRHEIDWRYRRVFNPYTNRHEMVRQCRRLVWIKQDHSGKVYYYDNETQAWEIKIESGTFWYCYWTSWRLC